MGKELINQVTNKQVWALLTKNMNTTWTCNQFGNIEGLQWCFYTEMDYEMK